MVMITVVHLFYFVCQSVHYLHFMFVSYSWLMFWRKSVSALGLAWSNMEVTMLIEEHLGRYFCLKGMCLYFLGQLENTMSLVFEL